MTLQPGKLDKAHRLLAPRIAYLIGTKDPRGTANVIPVSNVTSVSTQPQHILLAVHKAWHTYQNLTTADGFTLSVPSVEHLEGVWILGARYSGYPTTTPPGKLTDSGLALDDAAHEFGPVLSDGLGWMACRTVHRADLGGDHGIVVGQAEAVYFNDSVLGADGLPVQATRPLMQITGNSFTTAADTRTVAFYPRT